ncbi:TetR/AcrR family transcriptional regulator [Phytoactinopolyspora halotolerans]|uniref:TetR family transcriptional regulator n=1 Tax=Phytoactinopolyspora halotolerans TaxID=1981512 RepID=A0A6L9S559_9ACTN|nr:TetR/AcrR family transcriptional regulator [Phytoactinopolyspora halotolerans]NED99189.1 TetR family transcriptional regulator [Phytoactinopolyspora halotolerans]
MPRVADHDARRRQIADAVIGLIAHSGFDAATVARVSREAGVSVGLVQHYFRSKDDLLLFAYRQVVTDINERVAGCLADGERARRTISAVVFASMMELLPLDHRRRGEYRVIRAFLGRSVDNPAMSAIAGETVRMIHAELATAVRNGKECGEVEPAVDESLAALRIAALVDGLAAQYYQEPDRLVGARPLPDAAVELLRFCLDGIFTGECRHYG